MHATFKEATIPQIGIHAAALTFSELGIGSTLHALHIPFAGTILSLNQIFLLTRHLCLSSNQRDFSPFIISSHAALLKSLAPMGKKLTPMLAICMQGLLYNLGTFCFGNNLAGRWVGGILASLWSFCQQLILYSLLFGEALFQAFDAHRFMEGIFWGILIGKVVLTTLVIFLTPLLPISRFEQYLRFLSKTAESKRTVRQSFLRQAFSDLCKPLFLFSILITTCFFYYSEGISKALLWGVVRPIGLGLLCFFIMRIFSLKWARAK